jgi:hypothetical protein
MRKGHCASLGTLARVHAVTIHIEKAESGRSDPPAVRPPRARCALAGLSGNSGDSKGDSRAPEQPSASERGRGCDAPPLASSWPNNPHRGARNWSRPSDSRATLVRPPPACPAVGATPERLQGDSEGFGGSASPKVHYPYREQCTARRRGVTGRLHHRPKAERSASLATSGSAPGRRQNAKRIWIGVVMSTEMTDARPSPPSWPSVLPRGVGARRGAAISFSRA